MAYSPRYLGHEDCTPSHRACSPRHYLKLFPWLAIHYKSHLPVYLYVISSPPCSAACHPVQLYRITLELLGCSSFSRRPSLPDPNISMSPYVLLVCHLHPRQVHPWHCAGHGKNARTKNIQRLSFWIPKSKTGMLSTWMALCKTSKL